MLSQVSHFQQQRVHNHPESLIGSGWRIRIKPIPHRNVGIGPSYQYLGQMSLDPDVLDPSVGDPVFEDQVVVC